MRKLVCSLAVVTALAAPAAAQAGFIVEGSVGKGYIVSPSVSDKAGPTNIMIAPGYGLGEMIRAELGFVFDMPQDNNDLNLRLRPMLVIDPPIIPLYGRLIVGMTNVLSGDRHFEFGAALGVGGSIAGIGLFAEAGMVPMIVSGTTNWNLEGRAGAYYAF